jgi:protein SCO1/2
VLDSLDPAITERIRPLYVTVDPARDTPEVMKAFLQQNYPRFTGLTGTEDQVEEAKKPSRSSPAGKRILMLLTDT